MKTSSELDVATRLRIQNERFKKLLEPLVRCTELPFGHHRNLCLEITGGDGDILETRVDTVLVADKTTVEEIIELINQEI